MSAQSNSNGAIPKVALYNHNGMVGSAILRYLRDAQDRGNIDLIVIHRPGSDLSSLKRDGARGNIETRIIHVDNPEGHEQDNIRAIQGLNIVISAASIPGAAAQLALIDALSYSKDLWAYFPSHYGPVWTPEEKADPRLALLVGRDELDQAARDKGVPICLVKCGQFPEWGFTDQHGVCLTDARKNKFYVGEGWLDAVMPVTPLPYLAASIVHLILTRPNALANTTFHAYEHTPTGRDLHQVFQAIHNGEEPEVDLVSAETLAEMLDKGGMDAVLAALIGKWAKGRFDAWGEGGGERIFPPQGWQESDLQTVVAEQL